MTTRRAMLSSVGGFVAGTVFGGATSRSIAAPVTPWPYETIDPEDVRIRGHNYDYERGCAGGAWRALVTALRDSAGGPWNDLPDTLYDYGGGGIAGWGTICGALNASVAVIGLAAPKGMSSALINELMGWYTVTPLPTAAANDAASQGEYRRETPLSTTAIVQSVSESPLCHISVSRWCKASGLASGSPERGERCARLCGDTAAHAAELLNAAYAGTFAATYEPPKEIRSCMACHHSGPDVSKGHTTTGKLDCLNCHEPHM